MKHLRWLFLVITICGQAQIRISGIVKDAATKRGLPFATVSADISHSAITDIDGKFTLLVAAQHDILTISYVGYQTQKINRTSRTFFKIALQPKAEPLNEIVIKQAENPALAIIRKAIFAKAENDPQRKLQTFEFTSYNKLIVTAEPDSVDAKIDTVYIRKLRKSIAKADSSDYKFKKIISKRHLFQTEKVSEFQFDGKTLKESVTATKMSGLKQPIYELLALQLQSFSIYDNRYELMETQYSSPLSPGSADHYTFKILDTVTIRNRSAYMIYYKSKKKNRAARLQGVLYIDAESYAVAKAVMRIRGILDITAVHNFEYIPEQKIWFPSTREFRIAKGNNKEDIRILGETLHFEADDSDAPIRDKQASDFTYVLSRSWNFDIEYNVPVTIKKPSIRVTISDDAISRPESFWQRYRQDSTDLRSAETYSALDSIAQKQRVERKLRFGRKLINGYIPLGPIDVDLRYLLSYNNYEGFRIGFGGITNDLFSQKYRIDGYSAYGTKDGQFKYHLGTAARIGKFSNTWIGAAYTDDVREIASTTFAIDKRVFKIYDPRPINVSTFYNYVSWRGYIETKILPKTESIWELNYARIEPKFNYVFTDNGSSYSVFHLATAMVSLQWNPFSDYMQTPSGRIETEKRFPKFTFQFTKSLPGILENDFDFGKADFRAEYEKKFVNGQKSALLAEGGLAFGDVPLTHLYNTSPNNLTKDRILQRITFAGKNSFETMYFNEFFSSRYVFFQLKHGFKRVQLLPKIKPSLVLVSRMAWGTMDRPMQHSGIDYKTLEKGYFESGIELNQIFKGFGISGFYRYGPNQLPRFEDNIAIKLSFVLNLGF